MSVSVSELLSFSLCLSPSGLPFLASLPATESTLWILDLQARAYQNVHVLHQNYVGAATTSDRVRHYFTIANDETHSECRCQMAMSGAHLPFAISMSASPAKGDISMEWDMLARRQRGTPQCCTSHLRKDGLFIPVCIIILSVVPLHGVPPIQGPLGSFSLLFFPNRLRP